MRLVISVLVAALVYLQFALWFGKGGVRDVNRMRTQVVAQEQEIELLKERNRALAAEVADLKAGLEAIEARARNEMGMIKQGETFYQIIDADRDDQSGTRGDE